MLKTGAKEIFISRKQALLLASGNTEPRKGSIFWRIIHSERLPSGLPAPPPVQRPTPADTAYTDQQLNIIIPKVAATLGKTLLANEAEIAKMHVKVSGVLNGENAQVASHYQSLKNSVLFFSACALGFTAATSIIAAMGVKDALPYFGVASAGWAALAIISLAFYYIPAGKHHPGVYKAVEKFSSELVGKIKEAIAR